jgi:hypothetical protein
MRTMGRSQCSILLGVVLSFLQTGCEPGQQDGLPPDSVSASSQPLLGSTWSDDTSDFVRAVARIVGPAGCSGTLVAPDKILTAAHCLCKGSPNYVWFAQDNGAKPPIPDAGTVESWPVTASYAPADAEVCAPYFADAGTDDVAYHVAWDIALLVIGKSGPPYNRLPPFPQVPVFLGDPGAAWATKRLAPFPLSPTNAYKVDHQNGVYYQIVGYGKAIPFNWGAWSMSRLQIVAAAACSTPRQSCWQMACYRWPIPHARVN